MMRERFEGCLLGGAIGDALGAPVEFLSTTEIRVAYGPDGIGELAPAYGRVGAITDDTQMTLFTAEGLLRAYVRERGKGIVHVPTVVMRAYLRWLLTQGESSRSALFDASPDGWLVTHRELWQRRAPGNTCLSALRSAGDDDLFARNDSKGCGGIMRVAPVGLLYTPEGGAFALGSDVARLTHGHPSGYLAAGYFAELIARVVRGADLLDAAQRSLPILREHERDGAGEVVAAVEGALALAQRADADGGVAPSPETVERLGGGWVAEESLAIALYCALVARDFAHGVRLAVNHGGDSDSTGSLTGNLLGARDGLAAIPARFREAVELRAAALEIAGDLAAASEGALDAGASATKYPPS